MNEKVKITVFRGSHQIGGCCTVIEYKSSRIVIDIGMPLPGDEQKALELEGITKGQTKCDAIFLTHYHGDHIGELPNTIEEIPIYASECTKEFIQAYKTHMGEYYVCNIDTNRICTINDGEQVSVGNFNIKAVRVDHSAAGALMYYIEVGGKCILHTGDFRLHGKNREKMFSNILSLGNIDLLITEGTTLSRNELEVWDEESVRSRIELVMQQYKYCFVLASASNIDRMQSISDVVVRGKYFLMDDFQKELLKIAMAYDDYKFKKMTTYGKNIEEKMKKQGFIMLIRESNSRIYEEYREKYPNKTCLIYSMWSGYLKYSGLKRLYELANNRRIIHSSGHVLLQDLKEFIELVNPNKIAIIHTNMNGLDDLDDRLKNIEDGEPFYI